MKFGKVTWTIQEKWNYVKFKSVQTFNKIIHQSSLLGQVEIGSNIAQNHSSGL